MNSVPVIQLENITKLYHRGNETVRAVDNATLSVSKGEYCAVVGPSGSGKTTLMNLMGCLDRPTSGRLAINGRQVEAASESRLTRMRQSSIGFVFQQFFLIPTLTVLENVRLPGLFTHHQTETKARELLERVGLEHRLDHFPRELSGGEMQRAAVARSLINSPPILLADEPTGNLDSRNSETIMMLFDQLNADGITIMVVTHNPVLAERCHRKLHIEDGLVEA